MFIAQVFTLYPEYFPGPFKNGLYGKAIEKKIWDLRTVNIRDYEIDKHKTVDDTPYGGGSGMLIKPDVLAMSLDKNINRDEKIVYLSPKGKVFNQKIAKELSLENKVNIICGHFEGIDQRVLENRKIDEISLGDFVLSGGETATYVFLDAIFRSLFDAYVMCTRKSGLSNMERLGSVFLVVCFDFKQLCFVSAQ